MTLTRALILINIGATGIMFFFTVHDGEPFLAPWPQISMVLRWVVIAVVVAIFEFLALFGWQHGKKDIPPEQYDEEGKLPGDISFRQIGQELLEDVKRIWQFVARHTLAFAIIAGVLLLLFFVPGLEDYSLLIFLVSIPIAFGIEWLHRRGKFKGIFAKKGLEDPDEPISREDRNLH